MSEQAPNGPQIPDGYVRTETPEGDLMHLTQEGGLIEATTYKNDKWTNEKIIVAETGEVVDNHDFMQRHDFHDPQGNFVSASEEEKGVIKATTIIRPEDPEFAKDFSTRNETTINKETGEVIDDVTYGVHEI